jgi:hypothetical protein
VQEEGRFEEESSPKSSSFELHVGSDIYTIHHRLYESLEEFAGQASSIEMSDVVLLDLSMGRPDEMPGLGLYEVAVRQVGRDRVYVLSAFPQRALDIGIPADHVIEKPPDPTSLINTLQRVLAIGRLDS